MAGRKAVGAGKRRRASQRGAGRLLGFTALKVSAGHHEWVDRLGIGNGFVAQSIVALVDEYGAVILKSVTVGSSRPNRHQYYTGASTRVEIHAALHAHRLALAHFEIGTDLVRERH